MKKQLSQAPIHHEASLLKSDPFLSSLSALAQHVRFTSLLLTVPLERVMDILLT